MFQEVISRRVLVDEGSRQVVELEQAALWRFLWWSGTISVHVLVDQNRADNSVSTGHFLLLFTTFQNNKKIVSRIFCRKKADSRFHSMYEVTCLFIFGCYFIWTFASLICDINAATWKFYPRYTNRNTALWSYLVVTWSHNWKIDEKKFLDFNYPFDVVRWRSSNWRLDLWRDLKGVGEWSLYLLMKECASQ